jgi:hypothetical protein
MQSLLAFFGNILNGIRAVVGLVLPIFSNAADFRRWPGWLKVFVGLGLVAAICVGLYYLQDYIGLRELTAKVPKPIEPYFLPLLFLLLVLFSWLAYGLWMLFAAGDEAAEFPDIQAAWSEAVRRLDASGLRVGDAPLFLVLGRSASGLDALFLAAGIKEIIRTPSQGEPPVRVYAWDEAIFVVSPGASAWGKFCTEVSNPSAEADWGGGGGAADAGKTLDPGGAFAGADPLMRAEMEDLLRESSRRELTPVENARLRELVEVLQTAQGPTRRKVSFPEEERVKQTRRLRYLCSLIRRDRRPWCPINGVLVLVPWAVTESEEAARLGCGVLEAELRTARDIFELRYPTFALVCDLETARGFDQFRSGFRADMLKQRIGQRVPFVPVGEPEEVGALVGNAARWIGLSVLPAWILRFLKLDAGPEARQTPGSGGAHNRNLYLLMRGVFERGPRLAELLARGVPPVGGSDDLAEVPMFGGVYLAATGREGKQQAFVEGVFQRIIESQNVVSWSPGALAEDARRTRLAMLGYAAVALLTVAAVAAVVFMPQSGK